MPKESPKVDASRIAQRIFLIRGQRVLLDVDLARLYQVPTARLNQQVRRNHGRFPNDFAFQLTKHELAHLMLQSATSSWGGSRKPPLVFTEHGAIMAATVLNSTTAAEMAVYVVRAFVKLRQVFASNAELASKLAVLEGAIATLDVKTRKQFEAVYGAIRALMAPQGVKSRPIGFTADIQQDSLSVK
jgi:hypothetical protein